MFRNIFLIAMVMVFITDNKTEARNIYVNAATGNDATTYASNNAQNPWATIGRAVWGSTDRSYAMDFSPPPFSSEAVQAGDTVFIAGGTYLYSPSAYNGESSRQYPVYNTANEGQNGSPVVIFAQDTVVIQTNLGNMGNPVIGSYGRDYVHWVGPFYINRADITFRQTLSVIWGVTGCKISGSIMVGDYNSEGPGHNTPLIYVVNAIDSEVSNNNLADSRGNSGENNSAVTFYNSHNITIQNNSISNCNSGLYLKAATDVSQYQTQMILRFNWIENCWAGIRILNADDTESRSLIYQNILVDNDSGIELVPLEDEYRDIDGLWVVNNTFYGNRYGLRFGGGDIFDDIRVYNNIVAGNEYALWAQDPESEQSTFINEYDSDYNCWFNNHGSIHYLALNQYTYQQWQSTFNDDANSITGDPLFVNASSYLFQLQATSPCSTGLDILDLDGDGETNDAINMGSYVTGNEVIGLGVVLPPTTVPTPTGIRIEPVTN